MKTSLYLLAVTAALTLACSATWAASPPAAMKVYLLDCGWLECDANWMVAMSVMGTKGNPEPRTRWIKIPVYAVLIDHPQGKFLYDTGCDPVAPSDAKSPFPYYHQENQTLVKQLALVHVQPADITAVILSHLHFDHAGNVGLFQQAQIYVAKEELEHPSTSGASVALDTQACGQRLHPVDRDQQLAAGVQLLRLPGHSYGVLGLMVDTQRDGVFVFPSDAIYTRANYGPPAKLSGIVYDSRAFFASIERVRRLAAERNAQVMFPHDMEFFRTLRLAPQCYQ